MLRPECYVKELENWKMQESKKCKKCDCPIESCLMSEFTDREELKEFLSKSTGLEIRNTACPGVDYCNTSHLIESIEITIAELKERMKIEKLYLERFVNADKEKDFVNIDDLEKLVKKDE